MPQVIVLSANEAGAVRGPSATSPLLASIDPVALTDGRYMLGPEVLADHAHATHAAFLAGMPKVELATLAAVLPGSLLALGVTIPDAAPSIGGKVMGALSAAWNWLTA